MNNRCRHKDCIKRAICLAMFDLVECSAYKNTGTLPESVVGVGPVDKQKSLFSRRGEK